MGRFHRHHDSTEHDHEHHSHDHHHTSRDVGDHSGYETGTERVMVLEQILGENDRVADRNRTELDADNVVCVNLMSSPGAGKTALLARTIPELSETFSIGVVEGDIATSPMPTP